MHILITGGLGFIGSHTATELSKLNNKITLIDNLSTGSINNINQNDKNLEVCIQDIGSVKTENILIKQKFDIIYHFAAQMSVIKSIENPLLDANENIMKSIQLLDWICQYQPQCKFIFSSSGGTLYGHTNNIPTPTTESLNPISPYGIAKLTIEKYIKYFSSLYGLNYYILRYANVYGKNQIAQSGSCVIPIFIESILKNKECILYGQKETTRDFIYVDDIVEANVKIINYNGNKKILNIGTGKETKIYELLDIIYFYLNKKDKKIKNLPSRNGELIRSCLDIEETKKELNWEPKVNIYNGIQKVCFNK